MLVVVAVVVGMLVTMRITFAMVEVRTVLILGKIG
jgi:hypothetical protein